jgi:hypothetical protein
MLTRAVANGVDEESLRAMLVIAYDTVIILVYLVTFVTVTGFSCSRLQVILQIFLDPYR